MGYALLIAESPAYPLVTPAVIVRDKLGVADLMQITAPLERDQRGSPVFDTRGRLIGLAVEDGEAIIGIADRHKELGDMHVALRGDAFAELLDGEHKGGAAMSDSVPAIEELYERLLPAVVELWVLPHKAD
jgi:hypothetical protein